jgi:hypothetical protein
MPIISAPRYLDVFRGIPAPGGEGLIEVLTGPERRMTVNGPGCGGEVSGSSEI